MNAPRRALLVASNRRSLAERISREIHRDAEATCVPHFTANECELAAEVLRLAAENAGLREALRALRRDEDLAKDLAAKADAVRDLCARKADASGATALAAELRGRQ